MSYIGGWGWGVLLLEGFLGVPRIGGTCGVRGRPFSLSAFGFWLFGFSVFAFLVFRLDWVKHSIHGFFFVGGLMVVVFGVVIWWACLVAMGGG